ncbi:MULTISPECIES: hypothetical protein [unclassified Kitasatospora]|uniref:tetratricopeptide repeat protein n=1 Tax=unclassified Kitasatospora TaxID=2633591 RepID=UPI0033C09B96
MSFLRRIRAASPGLRPELDDVELGRVRRQLKSSGLPGQSSIQADQVERLLRDTGTDWDRRGHRLGVLAETAAPSALARNWRLRRPRNADALIFEAWVELFRGRYAGRMEDPRAAAENCYDAADLLPEDPTPWVVLLGILRLMRAESRELIAVWHEAAARDPWNREAHLQMLRYLSPEECGSRSAQLNFVDTVRASAPPTAPTAGVELTALVDEHTRTAAGGGVEALLVRRQWTHNRAVKALDTALHEWPRLGGLVHAAALADLNLLAFALVQAGRPSESGDAFRRIDNTVTAWPWTLIGDPLQQFTYWQSRAAA